MNILIVDDEYQKVEDISNIIKNTGIEYFNIRHETTGYAARHALNSHKFDLLFIDLHLPEATGSTRSDEGGISLFDMLCLDTKSNLTADVIFITGREDLFNAAVEKVYDRGCTICQYSAIEVGWKSLVGGRVKYISARKSRLPDSTPQFDIAVITALRSPELEAVLSLPYGWRAERWQGETAQYYVGVIPKPGGDLTIVAAAAARKGMPSSSALATKMALSFKPKFLVMLGICAGFRDKTQLGDIIVADPTWDWGSGKRSQNEDGSPVFLAAPHQCPLDPQLANLVRDLIHEKDSLTPIRAEWKEDTPKGKLSAHMGPMASGASVIADSDSANSIKDQHRESLAIEMEAYAVMAAAEYCGPAGPKAIAIKSVCDFADPDKGDSWQRYAAFTSARFASLLFAHPHFH